MKCLFKINITGDLMTQVAKWGALIITNFIESESIIGTSLSGCHIEEKVSLYSYNNYN